MTARIVAPLDEQKLMVHAAQAVGGVAAAGFCNVNRRLVDIGKPPRRNG